MANVETGNSSLSRRRHSGYTLVELMIVVAIVGILSAIVIPQYQLYTGRAQLTEAIMIVDTRKTAIAERIQNGFGLPTIHGGTPGIPVDLPFGAGAYADSVVVTSAVIAVTMRSTGVAPCVTGASLILTPIIPSVDEAPIAWSCATTAACKPLNCG